MTTPAKTAAPEFDPVWEDIYRAGHANRYPWDAVVSFIYHNRPAGRPADQTSVLEIGCGTAPNLWFAAREGFRVAGIDASAAAIDAASKRFAADRLQGDLRVGSFLALPFSNDSVDLAIDRAALTCVGYSAAQQAVAEVNRVLRKGGKFFCNVYSDRHASARAGRRGADGVTVDISDGSLIGVGQICFYDQGKLTALFSDRAWAVRSLKHVTIAEMLGADAAVHAEWRLIAEKL